MITRRVDQPLSFHFCSSFWLSTFLPLLSFPSLSFSLHPNNFSFLVVSTLSILPLFLRLSYILSFVLIVLVPSYRLPFLFPSIVFRSILFFVLVGSINPSLLLVLSLFTGFYFCLFYSIYLCALSLRTLPSIFLS